MPDRKKIMVAAKRIVVKIGTAALSRKDGGLDEDRLVDVARQVDALRRRGLEVILVSSGAIGAGVASLELAQRPKRLRELQAAAAVGQGKLMAAWEACFREHGYHAAQVLLTREDFENRQRYLNISNTLHQLLTFGAVPVVNENDTISVEELSLTFGDNDILSAFVANLSRADLLIMLSVVEGLYDDQGDLIRRVERIDDVKEHVSAARSAGGSGGMGAKLEAARAVIRSGTAAVIANGRESNIVTRLLDGEELGTLFLPAATKMRTRKRWIGFGRRPRGTIVVDNGARKAVLERGKSLLASGITSVSGKFGRGDLVAIAGNDGTEFARGLANYTAEEVDRIKGLHSDDIAEALGEKLHDEVIHRDHLAVRE